MNILNGKKVALVSLGCDKNRVDSERILYRLQETGLTVTPNASEANIIIINTCAFIESARAESIQNILEMANFKQTGKCELLIVVGCLPAKFLAEVKESLPEVDVFLGVNSENDIIKATNDFYNIKGMQECKNSTCPRILSTPKHYAYLKIADGCNNKCTYCTIPKIRGKYVSRPFETLIDEAKSLVNDGVKELILVAQDVTRYGEDLYKKHRLVELIQELSKIDGLHWIRLHYCYPEFITDELINEIAGNEKVCKYLDMPLQHISNPILKSMMRASTKEHTISVIEKIRSKCPDIALRTSIIVGFPNETRQDFKELEEFLINTKFAQVGFFEYSREADTDAFSFKHQKSKFTKRNRLRKLVSIQEDITLQNNISQIGSIFDCVCDSEEENYFVLRNQYNSPDVDSVIFVPKNQKLKVGEFYKVKIVDTENILDLKGEII